MFGLRFREINDEENRALKSAGIRRAIDDYRSTMRSGYLKIDGFMKSTRGRPGPRQKAQITEIQEQIKAVELRLDQAFGEYEKLHKIRFERPNPLAWEEAFHDFLEGLPLVPSR